MQRRIRLVLTDVCNFNCPRCYNEGNKSKNSNNEINADLIIGLIEKLDDYVESVILTGGEPLMYSQFDKLVKLLHSQNIKIQLTTNGVLLDKLIKKPETLSLIDTINISLDKVSKNHFRYKANMNEKFFNKLVNNINNITKIHANITINTVYNDNITNQEVIDLINFCQQYGVGTIKFIPLLDIDENKATSHLENIIQIT